MDQMKAQLRQQGMSGSDAAITVDMIDHGCHVVMRALKDHVQLAPEHLQSIILRGTLASLMVYWNELDPTTVDMARKTSIEEAREGVVKVIHL